MSIQPYNSWILEFWVWPTGGCILPAPHPAARLAEPRVFQVDQLASYLQPGYNHQAVVLAAFSSFLWTYLFGVLVLLPSRGTFLLWNSSRWFTFSFSDLKTSSCFSHFHNFFKLLSLGILSAANSFVTLAIFFLYASFGTSFVFFGGDWSSEDFRLVFPCTESNIFLTSLYESSSPWGFQYLV